MNVDREMSDGVMYEPLILGSILLGSAVLAWLISLRNHFDSGSKLCVWVIRLLVV